VLVVRRALASLAWRRVLWSLVLPAAWLMQYFAFVAHVRLALGRWPSFGENLEGVFLELHQELCWKGLAALCASLMPVAGVFVGCLFFRPAGGRSPVTPWSMPPRSGSLSPASTSHPDRS
jgi:hypothetical protein